MTAQLLTEHRGRSVVLTLSDPSSRNALAEGMVTGLVEALATAEADDAVRVVILRGDGGHFCAGGNVHGLRERREAGPPAQARRLDQLNLLVETLRAFPKPVIAAVEGASAGAGFAIALACDLVVAASDAHFVLSYAKLGLTPDGGASWHLARALPRGLVSRLVWLAEPAAASDMARWGLVQEITGPGAALENALALAERLADMAPNAVAAAKELVEGAPSRTLGEQLAAEREQFIRALFAPNGAEGLAAFAEKRPPAFR